MAAGCLLSVRFTIDCWEKPWPDPILTIDGQSYLKGAAGATWATLFKLHDLYHSPGYQIYLRFLLVAMSSRSAMLHASKLLSLLMFFVSAVLLYRLGRRWFQPAVAQAATALFLLSESWRYYCNMVQYEVLAGFLMLLFLSVLISAQTSSSRKISRLYGTGLGFVLAFLSLIQMRYAVLLLMPLAYLVVVHRKGLSIQDLRKYGTLLMTTFVLLGSWSLAQSLSQGRTILLMDGSAFRFHVANNPNALGFSYPYPFVVEPSGWQFILSMPGRWLWLIEQRALYLFGIRCDIWALPPQSFKSRSIGSYSLSDLIAAIIFGIGLILTMWGVRRGELSEELYAGVLLPACVILPVLFIFGSNRFLVPVIPLIALFQAYAIVSAARCFSSIAGTIPGRSASSSSSHISLAIHKRRGA